MKRLLAVAVCLLLVAPLFAYRLEPDFLQITEEYVSPHLAWAKPYAGGKVRALFIIPRYSVREVIELAERMDLDYTVVETLSQDFLGWNSESGPYSAAEGASLEEVSAELGRKLEGKYDVIVTGMIQWDILPREHLYTLMEKVHHGTGLVVGYQKFGRNKLVDRLFAKPLAAGSAGVPPAQAILGGVPLAALPVLDQMKPEEILELRQFHDGRMALLNFPGRPIYEFITPVLPDADTTSWRELHYDYYQSLAIRAIQWAAKKDPQVAITAWGPGMDSIAREALPKTPLKLTLQGASGDLTAAVTVRNPDNHVFANVERPVKDGAVEVAMPLLPAGQYFADVIVRLGSATANWATAAFTATSDLNIASLTLDKAAARPGETVTAEVKLSQPAPAGASVVLSAVDTYGRELLRTAAPIGGKDSLQAPFKLSAPLSEYAQVTAYLLPGRPGKQPLIEGAVATAQADLYVPLKRSRGNYAHAVWSAASNFNSFMRALQMRQLDNCGVDMHTNGPTRTAGFNWLQRHNMDTIPYATRYSYDGKENVRKPCLTDPKFLQGHLDGLTKTATELGSYGPRAYTLGDECFLARDGVDVCFSPTCVADLREWLKTQYADAAALNTSWGTTYRSLDEAEPIALSDARKLGQPARWVDCRRHMEVVYARMMERARQAIRQGDPEAEVGFDGPFSTDSFSGNDWWQLMDAFTMCNVYFHQPTQWEFLRSFAKPDMLLGLWYGGYFEHRTEDEERLWPWKGILNGFNSMWWYAVQHGSRSICPMDAITPSGTVFPSFRWASEEMKELRSGEGQALMNARRLDDGIGIHYSQSSLHASTLDPSWGRLDGTWLQTFGTLEDMGLQYTCVAYAQIEQSGIDVKRFPVFILPCSQAISPAEATALRKYVADGGLLLADVRPGVCDHHGKPQTPGLLDDLFGIERTAGKGVLKNQTGTVTGKTITDRPLELTGLDVDGDVAATDGQAMGRSGEAPLIIIKQSGKGRAVLLNYAFGAAYRVRTQPAALPQWAALRGVLALAKVAPQVTVVAGTDPLRQLETVRFENGPIQYLGFLKYRIGATEPVAEATVTTGESRHTYDMRSGQYLGNVAAWDAEFTPARAKLYARLPYEVKDVRATVRVAPVSAGAQTEGPVANCSVELTASAGTPGKHWIELQVLGPDGQPRPCYARNVPLANGKATSAIPLALNDPPGQWKLVARDSISHKTVTATFKLP